MEKLNIDGLKDLNPADSTDANTAQVQLAIQTIELREQMRQTSKIQAALTLAIAFFSFVQIWIQLA